MIRPYREISPEPEQPAGSVPAGEIRGACPVCESGIVCTGGLLRGGEPSAKFQELQRQANSAEEWRTKAAALELEHASRDIHEAAPAAIVPAAEETEYFL